MKIVFVIGGARSGKSSFALKEASGAEGRKAYIATAEPLDEEMRGRIEKHRGERGKEWETVEAPLNLPEALNNMRDKYNSVLIDCLTMWLSNVLLRTQSTEHRAQSIEKEIIELISTFNQFKKNSVCSSDSRSGSPRRAASTGRCELYIVSNEVGTGIVPENRLAREFRDLAGALNQRVAAIADDVYLVTAGIPLKIK